MFNEFTKKNLGKIHHRIRFITSLISHKILYSAEYNKYIWLYDKLFIYLQPVIINRIWTESLEEQSKKQN